jgi:hypothetical protein
MEASGRGEKGDGRNRRGIGERRTIIEQSKKGANRHALQLRNAGFQKFQKRLSCSFFPKNLV